MFLISGDIHSVKERIDEQETFIRNKTAAHQGNKQALMKVSGSDESLALLSERR